MDDLSSIISSLLIVLAAGLVAGLVCRRYNISMLVGYMIVGGLIGQGGFDLLPRESHELETLARGGALLLLFSVGIEFSLEELFRLSRYFLLGGIVQMVLVAVPLTFICVAFGMDTPAAILSGSAGALSSTVLVFKALAEWGQSASMHGRRAIGILLFQDVALVPLMLVVPLLTNKGTPPTLLSFVVLMLTSTLFVTAVITARYLIARWMVPMLAVLRSVEIVVLFSLCLLGGSCWTAYQLGLPPAVGALAAGVMLSSNRLSKQIDTIILPFRETFAAVFFVTLGTLLNPALFFDEPLLLGGGLIGMLALKTGAAAVALKLIGLNWKSAIGMGLGLAQLGEFSFLLLTQAVGQGLITRADHERMLFIALGTLIVTPMLLKIGLRWTGGLLNESHDDHSNQLPELETKHTIVIGIGPIGRQVASRMEIMGLEVCLVDFSPVNLHAFAQAGFHTVAGDARDPQVLVRAGATHCGLAVVSVPDDDVADKIVRVLRELNPQSSIVVRCRFQSNIERARKAGANAVISEEAEASGALLRWCEQFVRTAPEPNQKEPNQKEPNQKEPNQKEPNQKEPNPTRQF